MPRGKTTRVELRKQMIRMLLDRYGCMTIGDIMAMTGMSHTHAFYVLQSIGLPRAVAGNVFIVCATEEHMQRYMDAVVDSLTCAACRMGLRYIWPGRLAIYRETWSALQEELERRLAAAGGFVVPKVIKYPSAAALTFMKALLNYAAKTGRAEVVVRKKRHDVIKIACPPDCTPSRPWRRLRRRSIWSFSPSGYILDG